MGSEKKFTVAHVAFLVTGASLASAIVGGVILYFTLATGSVTSPIKVSGGAMTFRTAPNTDFTIDGNNVPCVVLPSSGGKMELYEDPTGSKTPALKNPDYSQVLQDGAQFDLIGHNARGDGPGSNGVRIFITTGCGGNSLAAFLIPESDHKGADFYQYRLRTPDDDGSHTRRFLDHDCEKPAGGSSTANDANRDEDTCEHLSTIYVNQNSPGQQKDKFMQNPIAKWSCLKGECFLRIKEP